MAFPIKCEKLWKMGGNWNNSKNLESFLQHYRCKQKLSTVREIHRTIYTQKNQSETWCYKSIFCFKWNHNKNGRLNQSIRNRDETLITLQHFKWDGGKPKLCQYFSPPQATSWMIQLGLLQLLNLFHFIL